MSQYSVQEDNFLEAALLPDISDTDYTTTKNRIIHTGAQTWVSRNRDADAPILWLYVNRKLQDMHIYYSKKESLAKLYIRNSETGKIIPVKPEKTMPLMEAVNAVESKLGLKNGESEYF